MTRSLTPGRARGLPDLAIVGASATGKTSLAGAIADSVPQASLVSIDALAVYRGMDIGTAKPTRPGDAASRHCWQLVDLVDASEEFSVAEFQAAARDAIGRIHEAGAAAVLVGGTGLYHRAVLDDLELPGRYPHVAARLRTEADGPGGPASLHARLRELDPVAAGRMEPLNARRVIRALEVTEGSGRRFSEFGPGLEDYPSIDTVVVGLALDRAQLDERLARRLSSQLDEGFVDEVRTLLAAPGGLSRTAAQAIGYREIAQYLQGERSLEDARSEAMRRLKSFARRQEAWFRRDPRVHWLRADDERLTELVIERWETGPK
ncbi:MAG: tRNA (adenosine(37)-N6)-dimethylallyltransferase MiaA [Acidimicrobiales bacterium]